MMKRWSISALLLILVAHLYAQHRNPVLKGYYADPEVLYAEKTGKYYIYPTSDGFTNWSGTYFKVFSSPDLGDWKDEGVILQLGTDVTWAKANAWAPCIIEKKINGRYKYFYYFTAAQKIGVAVADDPTGPFTDSGKPLIDKFPEGVTRGQQIDPDVFTDPETGKSYLYWGNGYMAVAELGEDMTSLVPGTTVIMTPDRKYNEGTYVFYRKGKYYFTWSENDTRDPNYRVRYGTADGPVGKITVPANNLVIAKDTAAGIYGTGHHSILQIPGKDEWYIVYHRFHYPDGIKMGRAAGYNREVCIDRITFDEAGNIIPVRPTHQGIAPSLQAFSLRDVQLLPGMFKDARAVDLQYILAMNSDRLLAPYLREAGLTPKAASYTNWESGGLDGHIGGHYLSALAMMYAGAGSKQALERLNYMISELKKCQDHYGDGYIGGIPGSRELWTAVMSGDIGAIRKKWVPLYNIHKTYAGIRDAYTIAGNQQARGMLIRFSDWFVKLAANLSPQQMQEMLQTEHGGVNEVLADVYQLTGDKKYMDAARSFSHQAILEPLEKGEDRLNNLHANTQIPKIVGFERIAQLSGDPAYESAARFFWETVVAHRTVAIGGNSVREHFHPSDNFTPMITSEEGPETCNTYNMLKLTQLLYQSDPQAKYMDYYERALYNHILSTQHPVKGGFVYFTSMRPGHYRVYSQPQTSMWCCVGSGMENHAKYNEMIYAHDTKALYVNLFIPSKLTWKEQGLKLTQQTRFPEEEKTTITIDQAGKNELPIHIRYPSWVSSGAMKVSLNGQPIDIQNSPSSWVSVKRKWKKGDKIVVALPMHTTTELLPDGLNYAAVLHGPVVLAAKTSQQDMPGLLADDSRMGHSAHGKKYPLHEMPMFVSNDTSIAPYIRPLPGKPLTFTASQIIQPASYKTLELIPFYKLHDSRYITYWQRETPTSLQGIKEKLAREEAAAAQLDSITVDVVKSGEQQPESDHFLAAENSRTGVYKDRHWRNAKGWFSYRLTDKTKQGNTLRVTYYGQEKDRHFNIIVNDRNIAEVSLDGSRGDTFFTVDYPVPASDQLTVKFAAVQGSQTGNIYEVRWLQK